MTDCIFCKIISKEVPSNIIYEDKDILAFLDNAPITPGHTLVVPKKHSVNLEDIDPETLQQCIKAVHALSKPIKEAMKADGYNVGINNFPAAGQEVMHTHFHIIPRFEDDGLVGWPNQETTKDGLLHVEQKIKESLGKSTSI